MPKMVVVNTERCLGCKSCMLACALAHAEARSLVEAVTTGTPLEPRIHVEPGGRFGIPLHCQHCEDAPCVAVCPTEALRRAAPGAPVLLEAERCIGCRYCLVACPFGVIGLSRTGKASIKCDLCVERTKAGEEPACVAACPTGALVFCEVEAWLRERRLRAAERVAAAEVT